MLRLSRLEMRANKLMPVHICQTLFWLQRLASPQECDQVEWISGSIRNLKASSQVCQVSSTMQKIWSKKVASLTKYLGCRNGTNAKAFRRWSACPDPAQMLQQVLLQWESCREALPSKKQEIRKLISELTVDPVTVTSCKVLQVLKSLGFFPALACLLYTMLDKSMTLQLGSAASIVLRNFLFRKRSASASSQLCADFRGVL